MIGSDLLRVIETRDYLKQWLIGPNWLRARDRVSNISGIRFAHRVVTRDHGVEYVAEIPSEYVGTAPG